MLGFFFPGPTLLLSLNLNVLTTGTFNFLVAANLHERIDKHFSTYCGNVRSNLDPENTVRTRI